MPVSARSSVVLPWSMWPAVPTTTVMPPSGERPLATAARERRRPRAGSTVRRSSTHRGRPRSARRRPAIAVPERGEQPVRRPRPRAPRPTDGSVSPGQRSATDRRAQRRRPRRAPPSRAASASARAAERRRPGRDHPPDRDVGRGAARPGTGRGSRPRAASVTLSGRIARASGSRRIRAIEVGPPDDEPGLRPADELVAAERDEVGAGRQALARASARGPARRPRCRAARRCPRSSMTIAPCAWASAASSAGSGASVKPAMREVRRVDAQDDRRPAVGQRRLEVGGARPVRRPDLDRAGRRPAGRSRGSGRRRRSRRARRARRRRRAAPGQPDRQRERRGVVVGDERVLGAGQRDEVLLGGPEARARAGRSRGRARAAR